MALPNVGGGYQVGDGNASEVRMGSQGAPSTASVTATLTVSQLATQILVVDQAAGAASALTLPLGTSMDSYFTNMHTNSSFDFSLINIGDNASEDVTVTTNTGWTLVGNMVVASNNAATDQSAGLFRVRKTGVATYVLYRLA